MKFNSEKNDIEKAQEIIANGGGNRYLREALTLNIIKGMEYGGSADLTSKVLELLVGGKYIPPEIYKEIVMVTTKLCRFCETINIKENKLHIDSLDDLIVYSAYLRGSIQHYIEDTEQ